MPRRKSTRMSQAARLRARQFWTKNTCGYEVPSVDFVPFQGTGRRQVNQWPDSTVTRHKHKLVIPKRSVDKKFVLLIGASHLRSFADNIVCLPDNNLDFGFMATPGACADDLRVEVLNAVVSQEPDVVCVLAPSNNLTASRTPEEAGKAFEKYLLAVLTRWSNVFCTSMVPRLTEPKEKQEFYDQEFHRRAKRLGVSFTSIAEHFPWKCTDLWSRDGVHLSDSKGMPLLAELIVKCTYQFLERSILLRPVQSQVSHPRFLPPVVVKDTECLSEPSDWKTVKLDKKRSYPLEVDCDSPKKKVHFMADGSPVVLKECYIPLNPVRFSADMLVAMEKVSPSTYADVHDGNEKSSVGHKKKPVVLKSRVIGQQAEMPLQVSISGQSFSPPGKTIEQARLASVDSGGAVDVGEEVAPPLMQKSSGGHEKNPVCLKKQLPDRQQAKTLQVLSGQSSPCFGKAVEESRDESVHLGEAVVVVGDVVQPLIQKSFVGQGTKTAFLKRKHPDRQQEDMSCKVLISGQSSPCPEKSTEEPTAASVSPGGSVFVGPLLADVIPPKVQEEMKDGEAAQTLIKGQNLNLISCSCSESTPLSIIPGKRLQEPTSIDFTAGIVCSVIGAIKHSLFPVCTWKSSDLDDIVAEGQSLTLSVASGKHARKKFIDVCRLVEQQNIFGGKWKIHSGMVFKGTIDFINYKELSELLKDSLFDGMCVLSLDKATILVIQHEDCFVVFDSTPRNNQGLVCKVGTAVLIFHTCFYDLVLHILKLCASIKTSSFSLWSISVHCMFFDKDSFARITADTAPGTFPAVGDCPSYAEVVVGRSCGNYPPRGSVVALSSSLKCSPADLDDGDSVLPPSCSENPASSKGSPADLDDRDSAVAPSCSVNPTSKSSPADLDDGDSAVAASSSENPTSSCFEHCASLSSSLPMVSRGHVRSLRGTFHQGDERFQYAGVQCVAVSAVASVMHKLKNVCSWQTGTLDDVVILGDELYTHLRKKNMISGRNKLLVATDLTVPVDIGGHCFELKHGDFVSGDVGAVQLEVKSESVVSLREGLDRICSKYETCFITVIDSTCALITDKGHYALVDSHSRNSQGMMDENGKSIVLYFNCLDDVYAHIMKLVSKRKIAHKLFEISGIDIIKATQLKSGLESSDSEMVSTDICDASLVDVCDDKSYTNQTNRKRHKTLSKVASSKTTKDMVSRGHVRSLRGTFHQGDERFQYAGVQCVAVSAVALVMHKLKNVFSWQTGMLDDVVILGDELYTHLRKKNMISGRNKLLAATDLTVPVDIGGHCFELKHGDFVSGDVGAVQLEVKSESVVSLREGLDKICSKYETCFITVIDSTCALITDKGHHALVDSHSRNSQGMMDENGKSIVLYFNCLDDVYAHIMKLVSKRKIAHKLFEISGIDIVKATELSGSLETTLVSSDISDVGLVDLCDDDNSSTNKSNRKRHKTLSKGVSSKERKDIDDDVVFLSHGCNKVLNFNPLSKVVSEILCKRLNMDCEKLFNPVCFEFRDLGPPCLKETIAGDGNCFFRAISQAVSGTQKYHRKVRLAVVKQLKNNPQLYESILRSEYSSMSEYIMLSKITFVGNWATEVEIQAAADFLGVSIFTYCNGIWLEYCSQSKMCDQGIYLHNVDGNHYDTVVCVKRVNAQSCYGYCKAKDCVSKRHTRQRTLKPETGVSETENLARDDLVFMDKNCDKFSFCPLYTDACQTLCSRLKVDFVTCSTKTRISGSLGPVCKIQNIKQDGNSFFRAVAQTLSGSQKCHRKIRLAVVSYMTQNFKQYQDLLGEGYSSVSEYISKTQMNYVGHCASEVEYISMAHMLGVHIYVFDDNKWIKYSSKPSPFSEDAIYLLKCGENFQPVICTKQGDKDECFGYCEVKSTSGQSLKSIRVSIKQDDVDEKIHENIKDNCSLSSYLKKKINYLRSFNFLFQIRSKCNKKIKYNKSLLYREGKKNFSQMHYKLNLSYREKVKHRSISTYRDNPEHREKLKARSERFYEESPEHREKLKARSARLYEECSEHREKQKERSVMTYRQSENHRQKLKAHNKTKYQNIVYKTQLIQHIQLKRDQIKVDSQNIDFVIDTFLEKVKEGPEFVCCVCFRLLFKHQVLNCKRDTYQKTKHMSMIAEQCIKEDYVHICADTCTTPCVFLQTCKNKLYICHTCHKKISKGEVPPESSINKLTLDPIPPQLACLNTLEQHLIALHIPFMKLLALPKGGQNGCHGPVTCVPANISETCSLLPRSNMEGSLLAVKLKRKLTYKGHYDYQYVDSMHVQEALQYLKQCNVHYKDVQFNESWINEFSHEESEPVNEESGCPEKDSTSINEDGVDDELLHDRQQHCMFQDTCLMPVDIGQEALDQYFDNVLNLAPGEGNNPVKLLSDCSNEAKCFPVLFPSGGNTYHESRKHQLTLSRYFNNRILHVDGRFGHNVEYIFFAQYMSELEKVNSNVSIALRKGKSCTSENLGNILKDENSLNKLMEFDDGYRFLKPIRGTPAFWQAAQRDILACVRQLGKPTWFTSFSSADMRWTNLLYTILRQEGRTQTLEQLQYEDKCELLRRNPVTAARMFDFRFHVFLKEVLMSPANPIGKIVDYYYRVEFQQRGSPHCHCLFWVEGAPVLDRDSDEEVIAFIDKYVTCELPSEDDSLFEVVSSVQQHSKRHSKTCRKNKTVCRFNFPRPPSSRTFICRGEKYQEPVKKCQCNLDEADTSLKCVCSAKRKAEELMESDMASTILTKVKNALLDENSTYSTVEDMFEGLGINQRLFEMAYKRCSRKTVVVLKRGMNEIWINQYSKPLLKAWNANIDIQYVVDAYACSVYVISYMSKGEKEVGLLLGNTQREASKDGNISAKEALKTLGRVYLHNRDVCAQEAVYRLTNMHLKECSRKVVFVPTGDNIVKMSLPLSVLKQKASSDNLTTDDMWMTGLGDRYKNRPEGAVYDKMCLATFASEWRVLSKNEKCKNAVKLNNGLGFVAKRTRSQPAVVRYARFSETKNPEKFHQTILQLFLPYRHDGELKPTNWETYEDFYKSGLVRLNDGKRHSVKSIVDLNRSEFEMESDSLDIAENVVGDDLLEDAWSELCPELEVERLESAEELKQIRETLDDEEEHIPDLSSKDVARLESKNTLSRIEGLTLIRSLNEKQLSIFYEIRQWCLNKVNGKNTESIHVFITGGAGTGKSHLIRAIQYESNRILSTLCRNPDNICVELTAPTGIAAYNLEAATIHSTFSIGVDVRLPYTPLGEEKLNTLRAKYCDLQLLIIDEISMVDHNLLSYIHGRLRQIKQSGDFSPFGNLSIIAVGDFFQLPPVKGTPLYCDGVGSSLWSDLFKVVELTEIVRQKDVLFSQLLNRLRTRSKKLPMLPGDIEILKRCETGEESSALHIFATNQQVNEHNTNQLFKCCPEYVKIGAQDYVNDKKTGKLKLLEGSHAKTPYTSLSEVLLLGKGARVMLCKNVDVSDGLVNGVCGTVTEIMPAENKDYPKKVYVQFDDHRVGVMKRKTLRCLSQDLVNSTPIEPEEERATSKGGKRRQFPLKLAWAVTVHKVQGVTVDKAVVCLDKIFAAGQAYVALSRVKTISGLIIQNFKEKKVYCKDDVQLSVESMTPLLIGSTLFETCKECCFTVFLMNVQSLNRHVKDLAFCTKQLKPNCIAVTETWLPVSTTDAINIDGYTFNSCPRGLAYSGREKALLAFKDQQHGGVGIYTSNGLSYEVLKPPSVDLECGVIRLYDFNIILVVIYRPPLYPHSIFKANLRRLLEWFEPLSDTIAIMGDFNDDILKTSTIWNFMTDRGFVQKVRGPTTERGSLIDHVYLKSTVYEMDALTVATYFSDHEGVMCGFKFL